MLDPLPQIDVHTPQRTRAPVPSPPPPSIVHLLLFVACCALFFGAARKLVPPDLSIPVLAILCIQAVCFAGGWLMLAVFAVRCLRHSSWPIEPGLWLGAAMGLRLAVEMLLSFSPQLLFRSTEAVLDAVICLGLVLPLFGRDVPARWKTIVTLLLTLYGLPLVIMTAFDLPANVLRYGRPAAVIGLLIIGCVLDRRDGPSRTWLHKLGIGLWIVYALLNVAVRVI